MGLIKFPDLVMFSDLDEFGLKKKPSLKLYKIQLLEFGILIVKTKRKPFSFVFE
jgi:hypothetical protein